MTAKMTTIYTLTPTHCGTGQAARGVDLPIARESHTRLPVLPATALKGVARAHWKSTGGDASAARRLFGPELTREQDEAQDAGAGNLLFTEAQLVAFPVRQVSRTFAYVTSPLLLDRLKRNASALGLSDDVPFVGDVPRAGPPDAEGALVVDETLHGKALVLEDAVFTGAHVKFSKELQGIAKALSVHVPLAGGTATRFAASLVLVPDACLIDLVERTMPVQARVQLTEGKTTDKWRNPRTNELNSGNLWYEESLPADTVLVSFLGARRSDMGSTAEVAKHWKVPQIVQIGGNETVGQGLCWWKVGG